MMKRLLLSLPVLFLVACGGKEGHDNDKGHGEAGHQEASHEDGKDGDKGHKDASHKEAGHDEGGGETGHTGHGESHPLGKMAAHGREFSVIQMGEIHVGEEPAVELEFATGADRISTVRGWIGVESGEGSLKGKFDLEGTTNMHGHLEVPDPIPAGSKLWLSLDVDGKVETHSIAYK